MLHLLKDQRDLLAEGSYIKTLKVYWTLDVNSHIHTPTSWYTYLEHPHVFIIKLYYNTHHNMHSYCLVGQRHTVYLQKTME